MAIWIAAIGILKAALWPIAITYLAMKFKSEIGSELRALLPRLEQLGPGGARFGPASEQQKSGTNLNITKPGELKSQANMLDSPAIKLLEPSLRSDLVNIPEVNRTDVLVAALAQSRLIVVHERVYRQIFGSQIAGLQQLNAVTQASIKDAREFFERETAQYGEFYKTYGFDGWLGFIEQNFLVERSHEMLKITEIGRDFLLYLTAMRLPLNKAW